MAENIIDADALKRVEDAVAKKQAEEFAKESEAKAKEIEVRVRKEITEQAEKEALSKRLAEQEEQLKKAKEEQAKLIADAESKRKADQEAFEKRLAELEAVRKGVAQNVSPFQDVNVNNPNVYKGVDLSKLDLKQVEEESRIAFMKKIGIQNKEWGVPPNR